MNELDPSKHKKKRNKNRAKKARDESTLLSVFADMVERVKEGDNSLVTPKVLTDEDKNFLRVVKKDGTVRLVEKKNNCLV